MNKKGISPLASTILLVVFAVLLGTVVMSWGRGYVEGISEKAPVEKVNVTGCAPLEILQIKFINGEITEKQYAEMKAKLTES